jgi:mersacidin/lichenicidin family type 2 lantibiotic
MSRLDIIRAWKDPEYRLSLTQTERAQLPAHPAGLIDLTDAELGVSGGSGCLPDPVSKPPLSPGRTDTPYCPTHIFDPNCGLSGS